jgi:hypothetical protein
MAGFTPHENIYTVPNILTFSRLVAAPVVGWLVLHDYHAWAVGLFAYAGITDLVDGYIARRWNLQTVVGTVIDPMADKMLMTILTICLAIKGALPGSLLINALFTFDFQLTWTCTDFPCSYSLASIHHPRPRCRPGHISHLLPIHLPSPSENLCALLGLLVALGRGATHADQQVQYGAAARAHRCHHRHAADHHGRERGDDHVPVSPPIRPPMLPR